MGLTLRRTGVSDDNVFQDPVASSGSISMNGVPVELLESERQWGIRHRPWIGPQTVATLTSHDRES